MGPDPRSPAGRGEAWLREFKHHQSALGPKDTEEFGEGTVWLPDISNPKGDGDDIFAFVIAFQPGGVTLNVGNVEAVTALLQLVLCDLKHPRGVVQAHNRFWPRFGQGFGQISGTTGHIQDIVFRSDRGEANRFLAPCLVTPE